MLCIVRRVRERGGIDQKYLTSADIFAMSANYETFKIFMSLPEEKLSLLEQILRQTYPEAYL